jgi:ribosomal protein S17E
MITINMHLSAPMQARVTRLPSCVTLALSSEGDEVVYFLKTVEDVWKILNSIQKALDQLDRQFDNHKRLVDQLHRIMDEAKEVVDDFARYVKDWASRRSEARLDRAQGI